MLTMLAAASLASPSVSLPVDVGQFDPARFPRVALQQRRMPWETMVARVELMLRERACTFAGQTDRRFDITVPYVVLVEPNGTATRMVVAETGCTPLETYVGQIVRGLANAGDFRPTGAPEARWYSGEFRFTVE